MQSRKILGEEQIVGKVEIASAAPAIPKPKEFLSYFSNAFGAALPFVEQVKDKINRVHCRRIVVETIRFIDASDTSAPKGY